MAAAASGTPPRRQSGKMELTYKLAPDTTRWFRQLLESRGWKEYKGKDDEGWVLQWRTSRYRPEEIAQLRPHQKLNHFSKTSLITKKDCLAKQMRRMVQLFGDIYDFTPLTFVLPREHTLFEAEFEKKQNGGALWICKPSASRRGQNIFIFRSLDELDYDDSRVVQRYIADPYLVAGYKFDMRIYVFAKAFNPLTLYIHKNGLARFSSQKYDTSTPENIYSHLTNFSINKLNPDIVIDKDVIGAGCKWTLEKMMHHLASDGVDIKELWLKIIDIAVLAILPLVGEIAHNPKCFELFGFDVMIDSKTRPWLLEINASPAMAMTTPEDKVVKHPMLSDMLDAAGFPLLAKSDSDVKMAADASPLPRGDSNTSIRSSGDDKNAFVESYGGFEMIFPFDDATKQACLDLRKLQTRGALPVKVVQDFQQLVVDRVSQRRRRREATGSTAMVDEY